MNSTNANVTVNVETNINARVDLNINITRNSSTSKLRHNFKSNKRPVEKSLPVKNENFEQVSMFDRWADRV